jgi:hypothetical protein
LVSCKRSYENTTACTRQKGKASKYSISKMVDKVDAVRATGNKPIESCNVTELRTLVIFYKHEGDAPVPSTR